MSCSRLSCFSAGKELCACAATPVDKINKKKSINAVPMPTSKRTEFVILVLEVGKLARANGLVCLLGSTDRAQSKVLKFHEISASTDHCRDKFGHSGQFGTNLPCVRLLNGYEAPVGLGANKPTMIRSRFYRLSLGKNRTARLRVGPLEQRGASGCDVRGASFAS